MLYDSMNLSEFFTNNFKLYVGFSAYSVNHHEIASWSFIAFSKNSYKKNKIYIVAITFVIGFLLIFTLFVAFCSE